MKQIVIGDKPLMQISEEDIFQVAVIQGCCAHPDYWNYPTLTEYNNTIFRDSVWCSYKSTREEDNRDSDEITFFFNPEDLSYHYHREWSTEKWHGERLGLTVMKFLIEKGYDVPIY